VLCDKASEEMISAIESAKNQGDSVGGTLTTAVIGMPSGVGEPWFDTVEGVLAHALFSIPAIKGVEFGLGFDFANKKGSTANDELTMCGGSVQTKTNNNGGINGGITNGMPITVRCAVKPTSSIYKEQESVSLSKMENKVLAVEGRHDPAIIHRARAVVDAALAIAISDALSMRFGTDYLYSGEDTKI
jgi:chorismate synthase